MCLSLTSCEFISNTFKYKDTTKLFIDNLLKRDYNKCIIGMAMKHDMATKTEINTLRNGLKNFRGLLVRNSGMQLEYSFMKAEKTFSSGREDNTPPNTTLVFIQFSDKDKFGVFRVLFDDKSKKILNINIVEMGIPIPSMVKFWLFGLLALCIPIFNIFVIRQIKQSELKKKWVKYIAVIVLNCPTIAYKAVGGLSITYFNFQLLFGFSFGLMGYLSSFWAFGIPLGGIYWLWRLKRINKPTDEILPETLIIV
ncbi:hypothetical protein [Arcticibacter eurypsychrophilus]|uniref:hypothetical protein n=1 Tax=Arcticibacter eurypsychrophilus TaxID=1434752 RepID=UPI001B8B3671|nr:hypothetical protein [Arcticibacter eurypsychrophilus]